jgi:anaerobic glycerol-3-phosphate dehydrogenase
MDMNGNPTGNAAGNSVTPRPVPTRRSDAPNPDTPVKLILFLPNENAELRREVVSDPNLKIGEMPTAPSTADSVTATHALSALFKKAGDVFPSGTEVVQVVPVTDTSEPKDVIKVELNRNFENAQHWSKGDSFALLATTAIANTVAANQNEIKDPKVQILVEGKPVETLGELDISEPIGPDKSLVTDD